ncbi:Mra1p [Lachancea thermotolerans CBS 6340]|uniref:KLTH0H08866p n=1 Tax=Lachancea thermotolerans (strain ATCC 56472 / CBS 6340 / NRRL Y-8284) TaxID=559295 RepID=C5E2Y6_LACTC|nr:KLTH0H08866p [Lachancea thermotolerans CBS 6340]CAR30397.1 KLTH0H08866p [Lachancea thermotolerans CBS 6340]
MRPTSLLLNAAKKQKSGFDIPVELTPLFVAMGVAVSSACWFTYKKFRWDESLRVGRKNPDRSGLKTILEEPEKFEKKE